MDVTKRPDLSHTTALDIVKRYYGIVGETDLLPGECDQNFRIRGEDGRQYVLKIAHPDESANALQFQSQALTMLLLGPSPTLYPQIITTIDGHDQFLYAGSDGEYLVRLVSYLQGALVADVEEPGELLLRDIGLRLGEMNRTFESMAHAFMHRKLDWDSKHALTNIPKLLEYIDSVDRRNLIEKFYVNAHDTFIPLSIHLPMQIIHNDVNDRNLLIGDDGLVSGIFDFGDIVFTYRACELANAAAYLMFDRDNPHQILSDLTQGYHRVNPLTVEEYEAIPILICLRLCISVCMAALQTKADPNNQYLNVSNVQAWRLLERLAGNWDEIRITQPKTSIPKRTSDQILSLRKKHLSSALSISYNQPLNIVRGAGQYLFDREGRKYLDCVNNVCHVGHCNPHVVAAAQEQLALLNTNTRYLHNYIVEYAQRLSDTFPDPLSVCFFVNSGSEANDLALRLARTHRKATDFIVLEHAYHGQTKSLIDISPYKYNSKGGSGATATTHAVAIPDCYRGVFGYNDPDAGLKYAGMVCEQIDEVGHAGRPLAGFIAESILGVAGQIELPSGYLECVYKSVREAGGVCIADEVQVGFGRVGDAMWAFSSHDVLPDIVTLGKPIGNGHPLAAVVTTPDIAQSFDNGMEYFNTYGGNPVSCAIGLAVLDEIETNGLIEHAKRVGDYFLNRLRELQQQYDIIGDVRGRGLFMGIELVRDRATQEPATNEAAVIVEAMKERSILVSTDGPYRCVIKIKPPMTFDESNVDQFVIALAASIKTLPSYSY